MSVIHFAHSNGFTALTYRYFLEQLAPHNVQYLEKFGHDKRFEPRFSWAPLTNQLIESIEKQRKPVIGLGHSLGAVVTLNAYYKRPDLFKGLIMMDPPFFGQKMRLLLLGARIVGVSGKLVPPAVKAKKRKSEWESKAAVAESFRNKPLFKDFHPEAFKDYIEHGLVETEQGRAKLDFSTKEEYRIFKHTPFSLGSGKIDVPSFYLYSNRFEIGSAASIEEHKKRFKQTEFIAVDAGHMFPMEQPEKTAQLVKDLIKRAM
tara:strand:- start:112 stop:891 length:780 start_codon:yes stop_codon:yes gene_type:complete